MVSNTNWNRPATLNQSLAMTERRLMRQERRGVPKSASDLLGPGYAPTATLLTDWNSDAAVFGGFFFSEPGAINSPDGTKSWVGLVLSQSRKFGVQRVVESHVSGLGTEYVRQFNTAGATRSYSPWANADQQQRITVQTADYSALLTDSTILAGTSGQTITLPSGADAGQGYIYTVKNISSGSVTVTPTASTIDLATTQTLATLSVIRVQSDGSNWWII